MAARQSILAKKAMLEHGNHRNMEQHIILELVSSCVRSGFSWLVHTVLVRVSFETSDPRFEYGKFEAQFIKQVG